MKESRRAEAKASGKAAGERSGTASAGAKKPAASKSGNGGPVQFQDPHSVASRATRLEAAIGREVRAFRHQLGMTVTLLALSANMSAGMLSKIENGQTSPSLATLTELSRALQVPVTAFFRRFEEERSATYVKAGQGLPIERRGFNEPLQTKHRGGKDMADSDRSSDLQSRFTPQEIREIYRGPSSPASPRRVSGADHFRTDAHDLQQ